MMERDFYSDDFERLIREKTEQYKMYPSEKAWKGIYSSLHTKKRWYFAGMSLLVTGIILIAGKELILPSAHTGPIKKQALTASLTPPKVTAENTTLPAPFTEFSGSAHPAAAHNGQGSGQFGETPSAPVGYNTIGIVDPNAADANGQPDDLNNIGRRTTDIIVTGATAMTAKGSSSARPGETIVTGMRNNNIGGSHVSANNNSGARLTETFSSYLARVRTGDGLSVTEDPYAGQLVILTAFRPENIPTPGLQIPLHPATANRSGSRMLAAELLQPVTADDDEEEAEGPDASTIANPTQQKVNWLQDYAVYSLHPSVRKNKAWWQIYVAPTDNVRNLSGGAPVNAKSGLPPMPVPQASPANAKFSNFLRDMGFEAGGSILYKVSPTLSVKAGLQFNYSKFAINTYTPGQLPVPGNANVNFSAPDSGSVAGPAGSLGSGILHNEYYQLSAPLGLELRVWGNDRLQINIAATVQPTYLLNTNAYLLMQDEAGNSSYKQSPFLFRKWNIDGGAEAYISYKIGGIRLQAGPEFRYQFLSSYSAHYPIRENLKEYGLKIGIIKAIR